MRNLRRFISLAVAFVFLAAFLPVAPAPLAKAAQTSIALNINIYNMQEEAAARNQGVSRYISVQTGATVETATREIGKFTYSSTTSTQAAGIRSASITINTADVQEYIRIVYNAVRTADVANAYNRTFTSAVSTEIPNAIPDAPKNYINVHLAPSTVAATGTQTGTLFTELEVWRGSATSSGVWGLESSGINDDKPGTFNAAAVIPGTVFEVAYSGAVPYMSPMSSTSGWKLSPSFAAASYDGNTASFLYEDIVTALAAGIAGAAEPSEGFDISTLYSLTIGSNGSTTITKITQIFPLWDYGIDGYDPTAPRAAVGNVTLSGTTDSPVSGSTVVTLENCTFEDGFGANTSGWVKILPPGMTAEASRTSDTTATITFGGTPTAKRNLALQISIPAAVIADYDEDIKVSLNTSARVDITGTGARVLDRKRITVGTGSDNNKFFVDNGTKKMWINGANTPYGSSGYGSGNSHLGKNTGMGGNYDVFGGGMDLTSWNNTYKKEWSDHFAALKANGVNATRVWMNSGGITDVMLMDRDGFYVSVPNDHWLKLDGLFEIARENDIYIMATIFTHNSFSDKTNPNETQKRKRRMIMNSDATDTFIESYLVPFVMRYGDSPYLWAIDLCNEPDLSVKVSTTADPITWNNMVRFFGRATAAIHRNSDVLVTVGMNSYDNSLGNNSQVRDANMRSQSGISGNDATIDYYSPHYYGQYHSGRGYPLGLSPVGSSSAWLGNTDVKPTVLGEIVANGSYPMLEVEEVVDGKKVKYLIPRDGYTKTPEENFQDAYNNGWAGLLPWSSNGVDGCGGFYDMIGAANLIAGKYPLEIFPFKTPIHTVTFDPRKGTLSEPSSRSIEHNTAIGTLPIPTRDGYVFEGWFTETSDGTKITAAQAIAASVTYYAQWTAVVLSGTVTISGAAKIGSKLTAVTKGLTTIPAGMDKGTLYYQWKNNGHDITGANSSSYTPVRVDIDCTISVTVTAENCDGSIDSDETSRVTSGVVSSGRDVELKNNAWNIPADSYDEIVLSLEGWEVTYVYTDLDEDDLDRKDGFTIKVAPGLEPFSAVARLVKTGEGTVRYVGIEKAARVSPRTSFDGKTWKIPYDYSDDAYLKLRDWKIENYWTDASSGTVTPVDDNEIKVIEDINSYSVILKLKGPSDRVKLIGIEWE